MCVRLDSTLPKYILLSVKEHDLANQTEDLEFT